MNRRRLVAHTLATALLAGPAEPEALVERVAQCLGRKHRWIGPMCRRLFQQFGSSLSERDRGALMMFIEQDAGYLGAWSRVRPPKILRYPLAVQKMAPRTGALQACDLPSISTSRDLAAWLEISMDELDWFADVRGMNPPAGPLCHYRYEWARKRFGSRLIEIPKPRLREIQRRVLHGILDRVPAHEVAHGFRRGRSCRTFVQPHVGQDVVVTYDLRNFFGEIPAARVHALFETLGYPETVARALSGLCTNQVPMSVARRGAHSWIDAKWLGVPHLPQGAPTSPAIANLCALHLDLRLEGLAQSMGASYTRYADDLAISGGESVRRRLGGLSRAIAVIAIEEGFEINHRKTRAMHRSRRQVLTGIVVNEKPNVRRQDFDLLKAILTNCVRHGPQSQNRGALASFRSHLQGRIAHVASLNAERGTKLAAIFERIDWPTERRRTPNVI